jgi:hypothetical protein
MKKLLSLLLLVWFFTPQTWAAFSPISIGIVPPLEFPPSDFTVTGVRVSALYGSQRDVYGLDLGVLGNVSYVAFTGIAISGLFNITHGMTNVIGLQLAGVTNVNTEKTHVVGLQLAGLLNENTAESTVAGLQIALLANLSAHTSIYGAQVGIFNKALNVYGFQIGVVNVANSLHGLQIGLLNYNTTGLLAVSPILNAGF